MNQNNNYFSLSHAASRTQGALRLTVGQETEQRLFSRAKVPSKNKLGVWRGRGT
jgi:hypothetical protein